MSGMDEGRARNVRVTTKTGSMTTVSSGRSIPRPSSGTRSTRVSPTRSSNSHSLAAADLCDCRGGCRSGPRNRANVTLCSGSCPDRTVLAVLQCGQRRRMLPRAGRLPGGPSMRQRLSETLQALATDALEQRVKPVEALADDAAQVAAACHAMAIRFHRGGKLVCFGSGGPSTDAQHIAVEFVHPVIVGKRALPAISLTGDVATLTSIASREGSAQPHPHRVRYVAAPEAIALGVSVGGDDAAVLRGLEAAAGLGMLTIALVGGDGGQTARSQAVHHNLVARSDDPLVVKEVHVTAYHILWELVH